MQPIPQPFAGMNPRRVDATPTAECHSQLEHDSMHDEVKKGRTERPFFD